MAFRSFKKDIDKFYQRIDKIAKKGRDNFQEYYNYVDDCIFKKFLFIMRCKRRTKNKTIVIGIKDLNRN